MIGFLPIDAGAIAMDFATKAGLNTSGCHATVNNARAGYRVTIKDSVNSDNYKYYTVDVDSKGRVTAAINYTLTHRRAKKMDTNPKLDSAQLRKKLDAWTKKWSAPAGYSVSSFSPATKWGDAHIVYDRKVAGYWMGAIFQYSVDVRTGVMSRFVARHGTPGNTKLTISKADAIKAAEAILKPAIAKYGAHTAFAATPGFVPRRDAADTFDLGYTVRFKVAKASPKTQFYGGAIVHVNGATGKTFGGLQMLEYKGKALAKGGSNLP
jgi:hypothetical protein